MTKFYFESGPVDRKNRLKDERRGEKKYMGNYKDDFVRDFFDRTLHNLNLYQQYQSQGCDEFRYEVTQLINSFLGLIVFVQVENCNLRSDDFVRFLEKNKPEVWKYSKKSNEESHDFPNLLRHLRNAIAHKRISSIPDDNGEISAIAFEDIDPMIPSNQFKIKLLLGNLSELIAVMQKHLKR